MKLFLKLALPVTLISLFLACFVYADHNTKTPATNPRGQDGFIPDIPLRQSLKVVIHGSTEHELFHNQLWNYNPSNKLLNITVAADGGNQGRIKDLTNLNHARHITKLHLGDHDLKSITPLTETNGEGDNDHLKLTHLGLQGNTFRLSDLDQLVTDLKLLKTRGLTSLDLDGAPWTNDIGDLGTTENPKTDLQIKETVGVKMGVGAAAAATITSDTTTITQAAGQTIKLHATVKNQYGNPFAAAKVKWTSSRNTNSGIILSGSDGKLSRSVILPDTEQTFTVKLAILAADDTVIDSVTFNITVTEALVPTTITSPDTDITVTAGQSFSLKVKVADQNGDAIDSSIVVFQGLLGMYSNPIITTFGVNPDSEGKASIDLTAPSQTGTRTATATVHQFTSVKLSFTINIIDDEINAGMPDEPDKTFDFDYASVGPIRFDLSSQTIQIDQSTSVARWDKIGSKLTVKDSKQIPNDGIKGDGTLNNYPNTQFGIVQGFDDDYKYFHIDQTGQLYLMTPFEEENDRRKARDYNITVRASNNGNSVNTDITISAAQGPAPSGTVTNNAPVFTAGASLSVELNQNDSDFIFGEPLAATDADSDTLAFFILEDSSNLFGVYENTGRLRHYIPFEFFDLEGAIFKISVMVTDGEDFDTIDITITIVSE